MKTRPQERLELLRAALARSAADQERQRRQLLKGAEIIDGDDEAARLARIRSEYYRRQSTGGDAA